MHKKNFRLKLKLSLTHTLHIVWASNRYPDDVDDGNGAALGTKFRRLHHRHDDASDGVWFMTSLDEPKIPLNLPTPLLAIWERVLIALFMLGVIVLAITHNSIVKRLHDIRRVWL